MNLIARMTRNRSCDVRNADIDRYDYNPLFIIHFWSQNEDLRTIGSGRIAARTSIAQFCCCILFNDWLSPDPALNIGRGFHHTSGYKVIFPGRRHWAVETMPGSIDDEIVPKGHS